MKKLGLPKLVFCAGVLDTGNEDLPQLDTPDNARVLMYLLTDVGACELRCTEPAAAVAMRLGRGLTSVGPWRQEAHESRINSLIDYLARHGHVALADLTACFSSGSDSPELQTKLKELGVHVYVPSLIGTAAE